MHDFACQLTAFSFIDLPADDFSTKNIHEQIQVKVDALDQRGEIGDIPTEELIGCCCTECSRLVALLCGPFGAAMRILLFSAQEAVKGGFRGSWCKFKRPSCLDFLSGDLTRHGKQWQWFGPSFFSTRLDSARSVR